MRSYNSVTGAIEPVFVSFNAGEAVKNNVQLSHRIECVRTVYWQALCVKGEITDQFMLLQIDDMTMYNANEGLSGYPLPISGLESVIIPATPWEICRPNRDRVTSFTIRLAAPNGTAFDDHSGVQLWLLFESAPTGQAINTAVVSGVGRNDTRFDYLSPSNQFKN
jgi:hypothetical protein